MKLLNPLGKCDTRRWQFAHIWRISNAMSLIWRICVIVTRTTRWNTSGKEEFTHHQQHLKSNEFSIVHHFGIWSTINWPVDRLLLTIFRMLNGKHPESTRRGNLCFSSNLHKGGRLNRSTLISATERNWASVFLFRINRSTLRFLRLICCFSPDRSAWSPANLDYLVPWQSKCEWSQEDRWSNMECREEMATNWDLVLEQRTLSS